MLSNFVFLCSFWRFLSRERGIFKSTVGLANIAFERQIAKINVEKETLTTTFSPERGSKLQAGCETLAVSFRFD